MKKIITISLIIMMFMSVTKLHAQFNKQTMMLLGYSALWYNAGKEKAKSGGSSNDAAKIMNLYLRAGAGYFVMQSLAVGIFANWQYERTKYLNSNGGDDEINRSNTFYIGPFARWYFYQLNSMLFYAEGMFAFGVLNQLYKTSSETVYKDNILKAHLLIGMSYFITRTIAFDFALGYQWSHFKQKDSDYISNVNQFMACVGLVFFLGNGGGLVNFQR